MKERPVARSAIRAASAAAEAPSVHGGVGDRQVRQARDVGLELEDRL